jgi:threonylcarbamoyladenosine tRNA methylthiotransferase MtaB
LGCKVNQYETDQMAARFAAEGFRIVSPDEPADVYVVNTCSVTQVAESKSRKSVRRFARMNPRALVVVTGCDVEMAAIMGRSYPEADVVVPNSRKLDAVEYVLDLHPAIREELQSDRSAASGESPTTGASAASTGRTRAVVKVQDGCDMFCSFCSVPLTRGPIRSRPLPEILQDVHEAVAHGHKEVVLTGVLMGAYGRDLGHDAPELADVVPAVAGVDGIERVRLSSIEPTQVSRRLLLAIAETPKACPHLHIPLQSGDDQVLKAMRRPYTASVYLDLCRLAYEMIPDLAITTDVLVGFPGEDEEAHGRTMEVAREARFARMHVFRYSARPGTAAAEMSAQVSDEDKARRAQEMTALATELRRGFASRHLGSVMQVIAEPSRNPAFLAGYTPNYIRVQFISGGHCPGELVAVRLERLRGDYVEGDAIG